MFVLEFVLCLWSVQSELMTLPMAF